MLRGVVGASLVLAVVSTTAFSDDGVMLQVSHSPAPGEVRLDWSGGQPAYKIYRSTNPATIVAPANKLGETSGGPWLDTPPSGGIFFYRIVGPCLSPSTERCDGVDDDCDGFLDNGCPGSCTDDGGCAASESCDAATDQCVPDVADGQACTRDEQCVADHCSNDVCCASGDCCSSASQCAAHAWAPRCDDPATCQGSSGTPACTAAFQCAGLPMGDDSACGGLVSQTCGPYPSIVCTTEVSQPANQAALCAGACAGDGGCDAGAYCDATGHCVPDLQLGGACISGTQCQSGSCADGVCCNGTCTGTCQACDLAGSEGTCTMVPNLSDPDLECGAVTCAGFYWGWFEDFCRRKADVSATAATCNGAGACRTTAQECTSQTLAGPATTTCNATCQDPNLATCTGTTAGTCTNLPPGSQSCGQGVCQVTVPQCSNGVPQTCVPNSGAATTETCNNIDDNCDGTIDNNASFADNREPNNSCSFVPTLPTVGSDQTLTQTTLTLYPSGDTDIFRINATETDSSCACCDFFCLDEDYRLTLTLTVPAGAGAYQMCQGAICDFTSNCTTVTAGNSGSLVIFFDGVCPPLDSYSVFVKIQPSTPGGDPGYECAPYTLSYNFNAGVCN